MKNINNAKILLIYYRVIWRKTDEWNKYDYEEIEEFYVDLKDAVERAEKLGECSEYFVDIDEIKIFQDGKKIYTEENNLTRF